VLCGLRLLISTSSLLICILAVVLVEVEDATLELLIHLEATHSASRSSDVRELDHRHTVLGPVDLDDRTFFHLWGQFLVELRKHTRVFDVFEKQNAGVSMQKNVCLKLLVRRVGWLKTVMQCQY
jgi:hypothetical protein